MHLLDAFLFKSIDEEIINNHKISKNRPPETEIPNLKDKMDSPDSYIQQRIF